MEQPEHGGEGTGAQAPEGPVRAGALLRTTREDRGMTVVECAMRLRCRAAQLEALERGDLDLFGGAVYARGFLRSYADLVGADAGEVLRLHGDDPLRTAATLPSDEPLRLRRDPPRWLIGAVGVLALAGVVAVVLGLGGRRVPEPAPGDEAVAVAPEAADGAAQVVPDRPEAEEPSEPEPTGPPVDVILTFEADSWLEVLVDGVPARPSAVVPAGETLRFGAASRVALRFGNAGGVRVELNGEDLGPPGASGAVVTVVLGPDGPLDADAADAGADAAAGTDG